MRSVWRFVAVATGGMGLLLIAVWAEWVFPQGSGALVYHPQLALVISLAFWTTGLVVLGRANPPRLAVSLATLNVFAGLAVLMAPAADAGIAMARNVEFVAMALLPAPFVHFFSEFPTVQSATGTGPRRWGPKVAAGEPAT